MVASDRHDKSIENQAAAVLSAALSQVGLIDRALAISRDARLVSAREQALDIVSEIRAAMQSGNLTASSLTSLAASINIGLDPASLVAESESATVAAKVALANASIESHRAVERMATDVFEKHEFDADIARHTHGADLAAFKRREAEDERYIREQLARGTPEGDLNASGRMQGYLLDADAHGAGDNPDLIKKWNELRQKTDRLRETLRAAGKSMEEYDKQVREDVIGFLKAKGLTDAQVGEALAKSRDPLDAVEPYLAGDTQTRALENDIRLSAEAKEGSVDAVVTAEPAKEQPLAIDVDAMNAKLVAAGLDASPKNTESEGHGLTIQKQKAQDTIAR